PAAPNVRKLAVYSRDPADSLFVPGRYLIPYTPDVFPGVVPDAVKEGVLEIIGLVCGPSVGDGHLVTRLKPFIEADTRYEGVIPKIPPTHQVPFDHFEIFQIKLRLKDDGIMKTVGGM